MVLLASLVSTGQMSACARKPPAGRVTLQEAVQDYLQSLDTTRDTSTRFVSASVSLDDKTPMVLGIVSGQGWCGSGGCMALLLRQDDLSFKVIQEFTLVRPPIRVLCSKTNGWRDLALWVGGGGLSPTVVALRFDGSEYPTNPSLAPSVSTAVLAECGQDLPLNRPGDRVYP